MSLSHSEDVLEVFDAVGLEEDEQDEGPQAQDEAVGRVPVLLLGFLRRKEHSWLAFRPRGQNTTPRRHAEITQTVFHILTHTIVCTRTHTGRHANTRTQGNTRARSKTHARSVTTSSFYV